MKKTTLCYIECAGKLLMLHRTKKKNDGNDEKYIGLGGHFKEGETPEECMLREVHEEAGIRLSNYSYRGIVRFQSDLWEEEEMHLFYAFAPVFPLPECNEGELCFVDKESLLFLNLWEGDCLFLSLLLEDAPFFHLSLFYKGEHLEKALLENHPAEFLDLLDEQGKKIGKFKERSLIHRDGDRHGTVHVWIYRKSGKKIQILLQKRAQTKNSFPGCYDVSSAGHLERGEDFESAALREPLEELGVHLEKEKLRFLSFEERYTEGVFTDGLFRDREYTALYLYNGQAFRQTDFTLQKEEVEDVIWMNADLLAEHLNSQNFSIDREEWLKILSELPS